MRAAGLALVGVVGGFAVLLVWLWVHNHNLEGIDTTATLVTRIAALAGLLGAYLALVQVVLLARLPVLERIAGFDRLTVWHRWNGHICLDLVLVHVVLSVWGYASGSHRSIGYELWGMLGRHFLPGMVTATIGLVLLIAVAASSVVVVRRRLPYEAWYAVHLTAYAAIALAWFHEIPTGGDLNPDNLAGPPSALGIPGAPVHWPADLWRGLFLAAIAVLAFRIFWPLVQALRFDLHVVAVEPEGLDATTVTIGGRRLERLHAQPGQFFIWRFLAPELWWTAHPFSLSAAPGSDALRLTARAVGPHTRALRTLPVGTRVIAEGPLGAFTESARHGDKVLLVAGGIGITPIRALAERMTGDLVVIHRILAADDAVFADELEALSAERGFPLHYVVGDHSEPGGAELLSPEHLRRLVPDVAERDVFVCGPPAMVEAIAPRLRAAGVTRRRLHRERFAL